MVRTRLELSDHSVNDECEGREDVNRVHVEALPASEPINCFGMNYTPVDKDCTEIHDEAKFHCNVKRSEALLALVDGPLYDA